jgi:signal transduction histidine kinase
VAQHERRDEEIGAAADSFKNLSRLSGWIAHEINNPLAGIQNALALVKNLVPPDHPHAKYVGAIEREIARVAALTQRLHHCYAYGDERMATMPFARFIADAMRALEPLRSARGVGVQLDIDPAAGSEPVAGGLVRAAIRHLVQHAIETAPPEGTIRVGAWRDSRRLWLSVPDHALNELHVRRVVAGPPGLALELVRGLVRALDGEIVTGADIGGTGEIHIGLPMLPHAEETE